MAMWIARKDVTRVMWEDYVVVTNESSQLSEWGIDISVIIEFDVQGTAYIGNHRQEKGLNKRGVASSDLIAVNQARRSA